MGQAVAKQGPNTIGNTSVLNGQAFLGNFNHCTINSAAAARTDFTGDFTPTSLKPVQTYVQRSHLLKQLKAQLHTSIENGETDPKCVVVRGLGGAGKSQLVLDYIRQYRRDYSAAIWISAGSQASIERDFTQLYRLLYSAITLKDTDLPRIEDIVLAVKSWISGQDGRCLFVFDGADEIGNEGEHALIIEKYKFDLPATHTIITTRSLVAKDMSIETPIEVGKMEEPEAIDLFTKCAKLKDDSQASEVELIIQELGCLALAVTLAGFHVSQTPELALDLRDYLPIYRRQRKVLLEKRPRKVLHQYGESVLATWETSFQSIKKRSPVSAHFLPLLACISPDDIYTGLFCDLKDADDPSFLWKSLLCLKEPVDLYTVQDCLRHFAEYSLVQWKDEQGSYVMHQLVHAWGFERLSLQEQQKYAHAMIELLSRWTSLSELSLAKKDRIVPHITASHEAVDSTLKDVNKHSDETTSEMLALYLGTTNFLHEMGKYSQASAGFRACLVWYEAIHGPEHPDTISVISSLALTLGDQGKTDEAASMKQQVLEVRQRILGPKHPDTIRAMSNLANTLSDQGKTDEAASILKQLLEIRQRILGLEHPDTIIVMNNLALMLYMQAKMNEAASMLQQVLEIRQRILRPEYPDTISAMNNLAISLLGSGEIDEALSIRQQVLKIMLRILGPEHPDTISTMSNLANNLDDQGKTDEAAVMQQQVLELRQRTLGPEHPDTVTAMGNLAISLAYIGEIDRALSMQQQVLEDRQRILGLEHPDITAAMNILEIMRNMQQRTSE